MKNTQTPTRPILRYLGGKWKLAKWIISHFPEHQIYCEPFGGGASVLLQKKPVYQEIYNDLNGEVVNVFRILRDPEKANELKHLIINTPYSRTEFFSAYKSSDDITDVEQARRTITKSFMGFSTDSIERNTGMNGRGMTGFRNAGKTFYWKTPTDYWSEYPEHINIFASRLKNVCIEKKDAIELIDQVNNPDTLLYVDPPYLNRSSRTNYRYDIDKDYHEKLLQTLNEFVGSVVLSAYDSELYDNYLTAWEVRNKSNRTINNKKTNELLFLNAKAVEQKKQKELFNT